MSATPQPERWLFVDAIPHFGGHEVMLLRWLQELQRAGTVRPRLLAREGGRLRALAPESSRAQAFAPEIEQGRWRALKNAWQEGLALRRALRQERPELVVFASGALGYQMLMVLLARLQGQRVLVYVPLLQPFAAMGYRLGWVKDLFVRWFYARIPNGWVAISGQQARQFQDWANPSGPVFVLPNAIAPVIEQAQRLQPRFVGPNERLRVLVLGRIDARQKGLDLLLAWLEAAPPEDRDGLIVRIVGEGPYRAELEARRRANPSLAHCLELSDWAPTQQAMAAADVLLMPSRFEGVPLVMLEAMALGLPVVASDLPGLRGHVPADCLFAVGDLACAIAILRRLRSRATRERLARQGRQVYEAGSSGAAFARAVAALTAQLRPADPEPHGRPHDAPASSGSTGR